MADDAGFAVAITIRQRLLNDGLLVGYTDDSFPQTLKYPLPDSPPASSIDVFLGPPTITCKANNTLSITFQLWGSLTITMNIGQETRQVAAHLTLRIHPSFIVQGKNLELEFGDVTQDVIATDWDFTVISGSGFSPDADSYLRSNSFRDRLQHAIQIAITARLLQLPTIDIGFLDQEGILDPLKGKTAKSRVVDNALLLGFDVDSDDVTTAGDIDQLTDFARDNDIAAVVSAIAVPALLHKVLSQASDLVAQQGATLDKLQITSQTGRFHVDGQASNSLGTANFSFNVIPTLYGSKPGAFFQFLPESVTVKPRMWPALGFTTSDVQVDAAPQIWLSIVSILWGTIILSIPFIVFSQVSSIAEQVNADIASRKLISPIPRVFRLKSSRPGGPTARVKLEEFEIRTASVYIGVTIRLQAPPGLLLGLTSIPSNFRAVPLAYTVRLPLGVILSDPALHIRWTVFDTSGPVLANEDASAEDRETFKFVPDTVGPGLSQLRIGVRVYRTLGAQITDFVNDSILLIIRGPLAPGAYIRWYYDVKNPQVRFDDSSQAWAYQGELLAKRHSNLHRTDRPCANASRSSRYVYRTQVFDTLPFPIADIELHRAELCDYCFYGGPGGIRPSL